MKRLSRSVRALAAALLLSGGAPVFAGTPEDILSAYEDFATAQNTRDLAQVGAYFVDGPDFLWVSDGQSYWGRDDVLARMSSFQKAEHWKVLPDLAAAKVIELDAETAVLHLPLVLEIGSEASPDALRFLVSIVFRNINHTWRIAALLTTQNKTPVR